MNTSYATSILIAGFATLAAGRADANATKIPAADVSAKMTCPQAYQAQAKELATGKAKPERILQIMEAVNRCGAQAYNVAQKANGSNERAFPTATVEGEGDQRKVLFELVTVSLDDEAGMRQVCQGAAMVAGVTYGDGDPLATTVITKAGEYGCGSYVTALMNDSSLLFVAPTLIPGINMTEDVLRRAGVSEADIQKGKAFIEKTAAVAAPGSVARGYVSASTGGMVKVDRRLKCMRILGKKVCR